MGCKGLTSIEGLRVAVSGWVHVDGTHVVRRELAALLRRHGATLQGEFNSETQVVIRGDYRPHQLQSDRIGGVDALDQLALSRQQFGPHVHLIDQDDLGDLLSGSRVPCRLVPRTWEQMKTSSRVSTVRTRPYRD